MSNESTPFGVWVVGGLGALGALVGVVGALSLLEASTPGTGTGTSAVAAVLAFVVAGVSLGQLVVVYGLVRLQSWGYRWAMVVFGLTAVISVVSLVAGSSTGALRLLVSGTVLAYLYGRRGLFVGDGEGPARSADSLPASRGRGRR